MCVIVNKLNYIINYILPKSLKNFKCFFISNWFEAIQNRKISFKNKSQSLGNTFYINISHKHGDSWYDVHFEGEM